MGQKIFDKNFRKQMVENARAVNKARNPDGYIYILQFGKQKLFKFGASSNPDRRIKDIDSASPLPIKELGRFYFKNVYEMEECIHDNFVDSLARKEWFVMHPITVKSIIQHIKEMSEEGFYLIKK